MSYNENNQNNEYKENYVEISENDVEILGKDGVFRKYEEYKSYQKINRKRKIFHWFPFVLALIYAVSPIDLIPDKIFLLGRLDDILLLVITSIYGSKKGNFSNNIIINNIIKNFILSVTITAFSMMSIIYLLSMIF